MQRSFHIKLGLRNGSRAAVLWSPRSSRGAIAGCLIALCTWTFEVAVPGYAASAGPADAYFGLLENSKVGEACKLILSRLDVNQDGTLSDAEKRRAWIVLFGHSWGASAVVTLSRRLEREGIPVMLTVQVDSVAKPFHNDRVIPSNVLRAANFYQTRGLIHGRSKIISADPSRTTILGNFRREYKNEPAECRGFPWRARFFTKGHIEIECDPRVWSQVETLLRRSLRNSLVNQTDAAEPDFQPSGGDRSAVRQR